MGVLPGKRTAILANPVRGGAGKHCRHQHSRALGPMETMFCKVSGNGRYHAGNGKFADSRCTEWLSLPVILELGLWCSVILRCP